MSGVSFPQVQVPDIENSLYAYAKFKKGNAEADAAQQNNEDRAALRAQESNFASTDPTAQRQAAAAGLVRPGIGGVSAAGGLATMNADQREQLNQTLDVTSRAAGAILAASPDKRPALWAALRGDMIRAGATNTPEQYPGDDAVNAHRVAGLKVQEQISALSGSLTPNPFANLLDTPQGTQGAPGGASPDFTQALGQSEGGAKPGAVNAGGYAGQFQFGAPRLKDLGVYTPAQGEISADGKWNGKMNGSFNIPGFPDVKTQADFLKNPQAQRAAFGVHVTDIDKAIDATPGAAGLNRNGLRAVAHLGGVQGMQKFVQSGGQYNPADSNGTKLSDYYAKFAQGGPRALQAQLGHPDGPLQATPAASPAPPAAPASAAPVVAAPQQNALSPPPGTPVGQLQQNALTPDQTGVQPNGTLTIPVRPLAPGEQRMYKMGGGPAPGGEAGLQMTRTAEGLPGQVAIPGQLVKPTVTAHRDASITETHPNTGAVTSVIQSPDIQTLQTGDPSSPEYLGAYSRVVAAGTKTGADGQINSLPNMSAYRPPTQLRQGAAPPATVPTDTSGIPGAPITSPRLPPALQELDNTDISTIQTSAGIKTDLHALRDQLDSGKLEIGPTSNVISTIRNKAGMSSENSRNYASFMATLEKLRNDSLVLNKGVQTEGDAQRAWNQLISNSNDAGVVKQRLAEIEKINERAIELKGQEINRRRAQNGIPPVDISTLTNQKPAVGQGSPEVHTTPPAPDARVKGQVYQTPKGAMTWTGTGWLPMQAQ